MVDLKKLRSRAIQAGQDGSGVDGFTVLEILDQLETAQKQLAQYRVYDDVIAEIDRRADKEWCLGDQCDFTVTITYDQYRDISTAQSSKS